MGKSYIDLHKSEFRNVGKIKLKLLLHCKRHNKETKYFAPLRNKLIKKTLNLRDNENEETEKNS